MAGVTWSILVGHLGVTALLCFLTCPNSICFFGYVVSFVSTVTCLQIPLTVPVPLCLASASSASLGL